MNQFRVLLVFLMVSIHVFTVYVIFNYGLNILPIFVSEIVALTWQGQFNYDFLTYLILQSVWIAWRHQFSAVGIFIALLASVLGMSLLAPYLLILSYRTNGDMTKILLGEARAANLMSESGGQ